MLQIYPMAKSKAQLAALKRVQENGQMPNNEQHFKKRCVSSPDIDMEDFSVLPSTISHKDDWITIIDAEDENEEAYLVTEEIEPEIQLDEEMLISIDLHDVETKLNTLKWKKDKVEYVPRGESRRTKYRKAVKQRALLKCGLAHKSNITCFFKPVEEDISLEPASDVEDNLDHYDDDGDDYDEPEEETNEQQAMEMALKQMDDDKCCVISKSKKVNANDVGKFEYLQYLSIKAYYKAVLSGQPKCKASLNIAEVIFSKFGKSNYKAVAIRNWAKYYLQHNELKPFICGKHPKTQTIITDPGTQEFLRLELRAMPMLHRTPFAFMLHLNNNLLQTIPNAPTKVSQSTARRWMQFLGFNAVANGKNYYVDGHEREDVVQYREGYFLPAMEKYERRMPFWTGENMDVYNHPQGIFPCEQVCINIVHDECIVYSNDATRIVWQENGRKELRPKSNGRSQHVSGFCCACHGFICDMVLGDTFKIITPGKNADGYWTNADLVQQLERVIPIFELYHPDSQLLFTFDNSQNHHARAPGALSAQLLNKSDGGKNVQLQHAETGTWYNGQHYTLNYNQKDLLGRDRLDAEGNPIRVQKGLKTILEERGCYQPHYSLEICREYLSLHHDFAEEKNWLEQVITSHGHAMIFLPKFHCELNYIEKVWAYTKAYLRRNCTFNFKTLKTELPRVLREYIPLACFKRFERHCLRFMSGYRLNNLSGPILDYIMKKYTSHRKIPENIDIELCKEELKVKEEKKRKK